MVVLSQVVVVELDEALDGLLHRAHLDQSHLMVLPGEKPTGVKPPEEFGTKKEPAQTGLAHGVHTGLSLPDTSTCLPSTVGRLVGNVKAV